MMEFRMIIEKMADFANEIRALCNEKQMDYIDAVVHWCNSKDIEVELAASLVMADAALLSNIEEEAENLNYLKKTARLPV
jgi:hypothetical protein